MVPKHVEIAYFPRCLNCSVLLNNCIQKRLICHKQIPNIVRLCLYQKIMILQVLKRIFGAKLF